MATLQELMAQKEALDKQIEQTRTRDRDQAIEKVRALMSEYGLTAADLGSRAAARSPRKGKVDPGAGSGAKVAAKYRNASTGETWSGRGLQPRWLKAALAGGRKIEDFAV